MNIPNEHALILSNGNKETAINLMFRGGPCNICGGNCLSVLCGNSKLLISRILEKKKPVGSFGFRKKDDAINFAKYLNTLGISTYVNQNDYLIWVVVGTCMEEGLEALCDEFINETMPIIKMGYLYGYPFNLSLEIDLRRKVRRYFI
jgi:hypothetical protein